MDKREHEGVLKVACLLGNMSFFDDWRSSRARSANECPTKGTPLLKGVEYQIPQISLSGFGGFDIDLRERCRNDYSVNNSSDG